MTKFFERFLVNYHSQNIYLKRKALYAIAFLSLIVLYSIVVVLITFLNHGYSLRELVELTIWLIIAGFIAYLIYKTRLTLAVTLFNFGAFGKAIDLLSEEIGLQFYMHLLLVLFIAAAIHVQKVQLYSIIIFCFTLIILQITKTQDFLIYPDIYSLSIYRQAMIIGSTLYVLCVLYLSRIIDNEIFKSIEMETIANTDSLTKLGNRLAFNKAIDDLVKGHSYYFMILDLDHFKYINDEFGHLEGDKVLIKFSKKIMDIIMASGQAFRLGGEEFAIILPSDQIKKGYHIAESIRDAIEHSNLHHHYHLTVSIGTTILEENWYELGFDYYFKYADRALYTAKKEGRNRVITAYQSH